MQAAEQSLHDFIAKHREAIVAHTCNTLLAANPDRSREDLLGRLDGYLDEIVEALEQPAGERPSVPPLRNEIAIYHGSERHRLGFGIEWVVHGYAALCDSISDLATQQNLAFAAREYRVLNQWLDAGIAASISEYWDESQSKAASDVAQRIGTLAHELRNALTTATLAFRVIRNGEVGIRGKTADVLERSIGRMHELVSHALRELEPRARAEARRRIIVADLLREIVEAAALRRHDVRVRLNAQEGVVLDADARLLTSAVANLVQNALKFTHPGGKVNVRSISSNGSVEIEVEDECGGLPPGDPQELFTPFVQRADDRTGVGLGLTITREAAEANGGTLQVRDLPGKGCVFTLSFPVLKAA